MLGILVTTQAISANFGNADIVGVLLPRITEVDLYEALKVSLCEHFRVEDWELELSDDLPLWSNQSQLPSWAQLTDFVSTEFITEVCGSDYLIQLKKVYLM